MNTQVRTKCLQNIKSKNTKLENRMHHTSRLMHLLKLAWLLLAVMAAPLTQAQVTAAEQFAQALAGLKAEEFEQKEAAIDTRQFVAIAA